MEFSSLVNQRWSPREYSHSTARGLREVFLAVRMAQSSYNEQPWRYVVAARGDGDFRQRVEGLLADANGFAKEAAVLGVAFAKKTFTKNGSSNRVAGHDLGAANQLLSLKALELGYETRFMAGFDVEKARGLCPADFDPVAMFVLGKATPKAMTAGPGDRGRKDPGEFVFGKEWGRASELL